MTRLLLAGTASLALSAGSALAGGLAPPIAQPHALSFAETNCPIIPSALASLRSQGYSVREIAIRGDVVEFRTTSGDVTLACVPGLSLAEEDGRIGGPREDNGGERTPPGGGTGPAPTAPGTPPAEGGGQQPSPPATPPGTTPPAATPTVTTPPVTTPPVTTPPGTTPPAQGGGQQPTTPTTPPETTPPVTTPPVTTPPVTERPPADNPGRGGRDRCSKEFPADNCGHGQNEGSDPDNPNGGPGGDNGQQGGFDSEGPDDDGEDGSGRTPRGRGNTDRNPFGD